MLVFHRLISFKMQGVYAPCAHETFGDFKVLMWAEARFWLVIPDDRSSWSCGNLLPKFRHARSAYRSHPTTAVDQYGALVMKNLPPTHLHNHHYIKDAESGRDHDEEVTGHHRLGVIANESQPSLTGLRRPCSM